MSLGESIKYLHSDILSSFFTEIFVVVYRFSRRNIYHAAYFFCHAPSSNAQWTITMKYSKKLSILIKRIYKDLQCAVALHNVWLESTYSHLPNKWGGSNNRGGWKVSKMGRVKMHLINRERGKFPKRGGRRST